MWRIFFFQHMQHVAVVYLFNYPPASLLSIFFSSLSLSMSFSQFITVNCVGQLYLFIFLSHTPLPPPLITLLIHTVLGSKHYFNMDYEVNTNTFTFPLNLLSFSLPLFHTRFEYFDSFLNAHCSVFFLSLFFAPLHLLSFFLNSIVSLQLLSLLNLADLNLSQFQSALPLQLSLTHSSSSLLFFSHLLLVYV